MFELTEKGKKECSRINNYYNSIRDIYGRNALNRVLFLNRKIPACIVLFALSAHPMSEANEMIKHGYATGYIR